MKKKILILMGMLVLTMTKNIWAEEEKGAKARAVILEPITITASRMGRKLSEVPFSVSIISEKEIKDSNAKSVPDLLKDLEGIYMYDSSGVGTAGRVNMRAFWGGMSTHQLILIDGIPQNKGEDKLVDWDLIPLDNIERIEVVRGPASALYGDNAMSGVINIITKRPSVVPETKIFTSYGSFNTQNYNVSTSGVFKQMGYYFGASRKSTDGFRKDCDYENIHLNGKLDFLIDETQDLRLSLDYHKKEKGAYPWALTEAQIEQDRRQARRGSEHDKSKAEKTDLSATYHMNIATLFNAEGTYYCRYEDSESFYTSGSTGSSTKEKLKDEDTYGLLLRLNINPEIFGMKHSFMSGIDLEKNEFEYDEYAAPYQIRGTIRKDYRVKRGKIGPYVQGEIKLIDSVKFIGGVRYDLIKFDFDDYKDKNNSKETKMSSVSPTGGIVYIYQKNSKLYANYAQAFRSPTLGQMFTYGSSANPGLDPEEATNYEVGIHHRFNEYLKTNAALYWMELDNEIWYDYSEKKYKNFGETSHRGVETRLDLKLIEGVDSFVNYTYIRAKCESGTYKGKYLTNIPKHKGSFGVNWKTNFGLKTNLALTRIGSSHIDSANIDKLSSYTTVDTKISYEYKWFSAFLAINNLLDKRYNSYGFKSGSVKKFNPAPERTFTFGMEVKF